MASSLCENISNIAIGVMSDDEIRSMAVMEITNPKLNEAGSLYDPLLGADNSRIPCSTCGLLKECHGHFGYINLNVKVVNPLFIRTAVSILKCVCKTCYRILSLYEVLEINNYLRYKNKKRFSKLLEVLEKIKKCPHCKAPQPNVTFKKKDNSIIFEYTTNDSDEKRKLNCILSSDDIFTIFDGMTNDDVETLGFIPTMFHPRNLVMRALPVIPFCSRPRIIAGNNFGDDDLTIAYNDILKANIAIAKLEEEKTGRDKKEFQDKQSKLIASMSSRIATMFDNSKGKKNPNKRILRCFKKRLHGKDGLMRMYISGKRNDHTARTVIGAGPHLEVDEVGMPRVIAETFTFPEPVHLGNIKRLSNLIEEGKVNVVVRGKKRIHTKRSLVIPGTSILYGDIIVQPFSYKDGKMIPTEIEIDKGKVKIPKLFVFEDGSFCLPLGWERVLDSTRILKKGERLIRNERLVDAKYHQKQHFELMVGDIVERQLQNGDRVFLNRQPSLHEFSMQGLRVRIEEYLTFKLNLAITGGYNADFDGDEMVAHSPQSYNTKAEIDMATPEAISGQSSKPILSIIQDCLNGAYIMTTNSCIASPNGMVRTNVLTHYQFMDVSLAGKNLDGSPLYNKKKMYDITSVFRKMKCNKSLYGGHAMFSLILPSTLNYEVKNNLSQEEPIVKIHKGVLYAGVLDKNVLGKTHNSLIQIINKEYGRDAVYNFINNIHFIINAYLLYKGLTISLDDCLLESTEKRATIQSVIAECFVQAKAVEESTIHSGIREVRVSASLNKAKDSGLRIAKEAMKSSNNFLIPIRSGSKGDYFNIAQITGLLGQQNIGGERIRYTFSNGKRSLPHYPRKGAPKYLEYESHGFISHSFISGLTPEEAWFHAYSGREGITDTALMTGVSGYIQRRMVKMTEDITSQHDGTIRDISGSIYQMLYWGNGMDPQKTVKVDGEQFFCDARRMAEMLNTEYENEKLAKFIRIVRKVVMKLRVIRAFS